MDGMTDLVMPTTGGISFISDWLRLRFGRVIDLPSGTAEAAWHVHRPSPSHGFTVRVAGDALGANPEQIEVWLETLADHARDRAPHAPRHYHVTSSGLRIRGARN